MYVQYDIDIIAILILVVVLVNNKKNSGGGIVKQWLFRALIVSDILLLLFDMLMLILFGRPGPVVHVALQVLQSFFFVLCALFCFFWALFCTIKPIFKQKGYLLLLLCVPLLVLITFLFFNYSNGLILESHRRIRMSAVYCSTSQVFVPIHISYLLLFKC